MCKHHQFKHLITHQCKTRKTETQISCAMMVDVRYNASLPASQEGYCYWMQMQLWPGSQLIWRTHQLWCPVMSNSLVLQPWSLHSMCRRNHKLAEFQFLILSISSVELRSHMLQDCQHCLWIWCNKVTRIEVGGNFIPSLKEVPIAIQMKMRERKIETAVKGRSECKVGTKKAKRA
jgi:hypothetical protein